MPSTDECLGKETVATITRTFREAEEDALSHSGGLSVPLYLRAVGSTVKLHGE
jgi:hypothetical protein